MTVTDPRAVALIDFIKGLLTRRDVVLKPDTPLVSSGLLDSFALVDVVLKLEEVTGKRFGAGRVSPTDLETVETMLAFADRAS